MGMGASFLGRDILSKDARGHWEKYGNNAEYWEKGVTASSGAPYLVVPLSVYWRDYHPGKKGSTMARKKAAKKSPRKRARKARKTAHKRPRKTAHKRLRKTTRRRASKRCGHMPKKRTYKAKCGTYVLTFHAGKGKAKKARKSRRRRRK